MTRETPLLPRETQKPNRRTPRMEPGRPVRLMSTQAGVEATEHLTFGKEFQD